MGPRSNCARPEGVSEIVVTGKREKWTVMAWEEREALRVVTRSWVSGSRAVLEDGVRIPRRMCLGILVVGKLRDRVRGKEKQK